MNETMTNETMVTEAVTNEPLIVTTKTRPITQQKFLNRNTITAGIIGAAAGAVGSWLATKLIEKKRKEYIQRAAEYMENNEEDFFDDDEEE